MPRISLCLSLLLPLLLSRSASAQDDARAHGIYTAFSVGVEPEEWRGEGEQDKTRVGGTLGARERIGPFTFSGDLVFTSGGTRHLNGGIQLDFFRGPSTWNKVAPRAYLETGVGLYRSELMPEPSKNQPRMDDSEPWKGTIYAGFGLEWGYGVLVRAIIDPELGVSVPTIFLSTGSTLFF